MNTLSEYWFICTWSTLLPSGTTKPWMGYSLSQKGQRTYGQLLPAWGHALQAMALDWKRLNSWPQLGHR